MPGRFRPRRRSLVATIVVAAVVPVAVPASADARERLYVSLGDSYASGYEATGPRTGRNTRNGFAYQVPAAARTRGYRLRLVNFACAGATTTSILTRRGCPARARAIGGPRYRTTQIAAAERFLRAHRGDVALITVSIGGNDVGRCANAAGPIDCLSTSVRTMKRNATAIAERLRRAAGRGPRLTGITYPDILLEKWLRSNAGKLVAALSVAAFREMINPALREAYTAGRGVLADVTAATGAYGPFDRMTTTRAYGRIPVPVAKVCKYTHVCRYGDIHANRAGHGVIARLVARTLRRR